MFNLFDKKIDDVKMEKVVVMASIIHICKKLGVTPKEFNEFTSPEKVKEATNFLLEAMKYNTK